MVKIKASIVHLRKLKKKRGIIAKKLLLSILTSSVAKIFPNRVHRSRNLLTK